jgi:hypothetical protein
MTPPKHRRPTLTLTVLAIAILVFVGVTAADATAGGTINIPAPTPGETMVTAMLAIMGFFGKRAIRQLDDIGKKCDATNKDFGEFQAEIRIALQGYDGRGGALNEIRDLQSVVFRDAPPVAAPQGFSMPSTLSPKQDKAV